MNECLKPHSEFSVELMGEESRRWNSRMQNSSLLTSTSRIHLQMEQFSQSTCWTLVEDFRHLKGQEKSPHKRKRKRKRNQKRDQQPWWEAESEQRPLHSENTPHSGKISWDRKGPSGDQRRKQWTVYGRQNKVRTECMVCAAAMHTSAWVMCLLLQKGDGC